MHVIIRFLTQNQEQLEQTMAWGYHLLDILGMKNVTSYVSYQLDKSQLWRDYHLLVRFLPTIRWLSAPLRLKEISLGFSKTCLDLI